MKSALKNKSWNVVLVFLLASLSLGALKGDSLRIASYNVRNYLTMDRLAEGRWRKEYPKPESEKRVVRETILAVRPDALALQEIGTRGHLEELRRDLAREGLVYEGSAWMEAQDSERHVAALWVEGLEVRAIPHRDLRIKYMGQYDNVKRGMLELRISDGQGEWSLFNLHLKSKYTDVKSDPMSTQRRTLEARAARDRIVKVYPDLERRRYLVVGDLNDSPASGALRALAKRGDRILSVPIEFQDSRGHRWTHFYKREDSYTRIDYMLRSPGWKALASITGTIDERPDYYEGSDHRLIWMEVPIE